MQIPDDVGHDANSTTDLQQIILEEQLKMLEQQSELLDTQKKVYLLQRDALLAELNVHKSNEYF